MFSFFVCQLCGICGTVALILDLVVKRFRVKLIEKWLEKASVVWPLRYCHCWLWLKPGQEYVHIY